MCTRRFFISQQKTDPTYIAVLQSRRIFTVSHKNEPTTYLNGQAKYNTMKLATGIKTSGVLGIIALEPFGVPSIRPLLSNVK